MVGVTQERRLQRRWPLADLGALALLTLLLWLVPALANHGQAGQTAPVQADRALTTSDAAVLARADALALALAAPPQTAVAGR